MKIKEQLQKTLEASRKLNLVDTDKVNAVLKELAIQARRNTDFILNENRKDLDRMDSASYNFV